MFNIHIGNKRILYVKVLKLQILQEQIKPTMSKKYTHFLCALSILNFKCSVQFKFRRGKLHFP